MKTLLRSKNFLNTFWNLLDVVIYPVVFLAFTPFFIHHMGEEDFGLWMLINSVLISFQLLNFGLGSATQRNVARNMGKEDPEAVYLSINTNLSLAGLLLILCLLLGILLAFGVEYGGLFNLESHLQRKAAWLMIFASALISIKFFEQILQAALKGKEDFKLSSRISLAARFSILASNLAWVITGFGLTEMILAQMAIGILYLFIYLHFVKRSFFGYRLKFELNKANIREELTYGIHTWMQSIAVIVTYQMDRFIVTSFFGLAVLSYYSIAATMFNHIHMSFNALAPWMLPKVAHMREKGKEVIALFLSARSFTLLVAISLLLLFYGLSQPLFHLWLGAELYLKIEGFIELFILFELFFIFTSPRYYFLNANGQERLLTKLTFALSGVTLLGMFSGLFLFDSPEGMLYGLIAGTFVGILLENYVINKQVLRLNTWKESFLLLVPSILAGIIVISTNPMVMLNCSLALVTLCYLLFVRSGEFNLKLLLFG
ncbi:MAG: oligosaccharide flippase family protein [Bacteroidota bacterium]|nr:oligosaccharide flippase family protein [Bacteroidota bacterium]MDX5431725.1 oligosaccharide flippase family protein [Bacteroidota bacterium]MDX5470440.1 oligosaccharide flippase family protein [Bacteroidota bacterium]